MNKPALTPEDWIAAAFSRLETGGIAAVRAEAIARDLGVSKGSFYWHFKDLPDLKARMLAQWWDQATSNVVTLADEADDDPRQRIERLMDLATADVPFGGPSTEAAIRDWARTDPVAAEVQAQSDTWRRGYVAEMLRKSGLSRAQAEVGARVILMAFTGAVHQGISDRARLRADMQVVVDAILRA